MNAIIHFICGLPTTSKSNRNPTHCCRWFPVQCDFLQSHPSCISLFTDRMFDRLISPFHFDESPSGKVIIFSLFQLMLNRILTDGPTTVGIFRRSPNARAMRELRDKLDHDDELVDFKECSVFVVAALLKDFLRSMPDCLLLCERYSSWIQKAEVFGEDKDISGLKRCVKDLITFLFHPFSVMVYGHSLI